MELNEANQEANARPVQAGPGAATPASAHRAGDAIYASQAGNGPCDCDDESGSRASAASRTPISYVYVLGSIEPRFPSLAVEKEFAQVAGRSETAGLTDRQAMHKILSQRENRYLARQLCWVLTVEDLDTYILQPRDPMDFELLVEAVRAGPSPGDVDVVIGLRGAIAPPDLCNGLMVPMVAFDQIYSFDRAALVESIPRPEQISKEQFQSAAQELFDRIMQMTDNAGATDEHRALNYLALRYPGIYARTAEAYGQNFSLTAVDVRPSALSGARRIVECIFSYTHRERDFTEKYSVRVDVTEEFPFLRNKLQPTYDR